MGRGDKKRPEVNGSCYIRMARKPERKRERGWKLEQKRDGEGDEAGVAGRKGRRAGPAGQVRVGAVG